MEAAKEIIVEDSDSDNEEIFFGPITKREVMSKLIHNNLCSEELLEPLQKYTDNDVLDDSIIKFYYEDAFPKGSISEENSWTSRFTKSSANVSSDRNIDDSFTNTESIAPTGLMKDSLDQSDRELLKNFVPSETRSSNTTQDKSTLEQEELYDSLNIQHLSLHDQISINSTLENSASVSLNSTPDKCEIVPLNFPKDKSISLNCTPQAESFKSIPEQSVCSYSDTNDNSGFNCTLDEMELFMKFGENYINESKGRSPSIKTVSDERSQIESEKENYSPIPSTEKKKEHNKLIPRHHYDSESPSPFKLPTRSIFKKSPATTYRNIVSPVAMYIRSTPKVPLVQNVSKKTVHACTFRETRSALEDCVEPVEPSATPGLPARSYRPASRSVVLSREPELALPGKLRRLIRGPLLHEVIRHVGRVASGPTELAAQDASPANDFTMLSSSLASAGDVSVYVSTNAARTNRLQHTHMNAKKNSPFK